MLLEQLGIEPGELDLGVGAIHDRAAPEEIGRAGYAGQRRRNQAGGTAFRGRDRLLSLDQDAAHLFGEGVKVAQRRMAHIPVDQRMARIVTCV